LVKNWEEEPPLTDKKKDISVFLRGIEGCIRLLLSLNIPDIADCFLCAQSQQQQKCDKGLGLSGLVLQCLETPYLQDKHIRCKK